MSVPPLEPLQPTTDANNDPDRDDAADPLHAILGQAEAGEWPEVATRLRELLETSPDDPSILCWLGVAESELGLEGVAYERFRRALAAEPTDPTILATAGAALARLDDPAAEGALRSAALLGPEIASARLHYGAYLSREGLLDDALVELSAAAKLDPDDPRVDRERGVLHGLAGRHEEAVEAFEEAVRKDPRDGYAFVLLGLLHLTSGEGSVAAGYLAQGAHLAPGDMAAQLLAGLAAKVEGLGAAAAEFVERARLAAAPEELDTVLEVEDAVEEDVGAGEDGAGQDEATDMLMDLTASELRRRYAERL